jgi:HlyD family secretion protein
MSVNQFRQEALNKLNSPEQLDQTINYARSREWLLVAVTSILLATLGVWSYFGRIPVSIKGNGVLISSSGFNEIRSSYTGNIDTLYVKVGDKVSKGQKLVSVEQIDQHLMINSLEKQLAQKKTERHFFLGFTKASDKTSIISALQRDLIQNEVQEKIAIDSVSKSIREADRLFWKNQQEFYQDKKEEKQLLLDKLRNFNRSYLDEIQKDIDVIQSELNIAYSRYNLSTSIICPYDGKVTEIIQGEGDPINLQKPILLLENTEKVKESLISVLYVNARSGKNIKCGMKIYLEPSTVEFEKYGYLVAEVSYVSDYPSTNGGMMNLMRNQELVNDLSSEGLPLLVEAKLIRDSLSFSGYKWTTGTGPDVHLGSGLFTSGKIIIYYKKPISYLFPFIH